MSAVFISFVKKKKIVTQVDVKLPWCMMIKLLLYAWSSNRLLIIFLGLRVLWCFTPYLRLMAIVSHLFYKIQVNTMYCGDLLSKARMWNESWVRNYPTQLKDTMITAPVSSKTITGISPILTILINCILALFVRLWWDKLAHDHSAAFRGLDIIRYKPATKKNLHSDVSWGLLVLSFK